MRLDELDFGWKFFSACLVAFIALNYGLAYFPDSTENRFRVVDAMTAAVVAFGAYSTYRAARAAIMLYRKKALSSFDRFSFATAVLALVSIFFLILMSLNRVPYVQ